MRCVYLDYETYYDKDYSLKKLSIEEYVRDPRFETQLLGVAVDSGPVYMFPAEQIPQVLTTLRLSDPDCITFAQNARFDIFITTEHYRMPVSCPVCTRAMSRWTGISRITRESLEAQCDFLGTGVKGTYIESMSGRHVRDLTASDYAEYKAYCTGDVMQLRANVQKMLPFMTADAMAFIIMTIKMYTDPVFHLDRDKLEAYYEKLVTAHKESQAKLQHLFNFSSPEAFLKAIRSKKQFCEMLKKVGGVVPYKVSAKKTAIALSNLNKRSKELDFIINGTVPQSAEYEKALEEKRTVQRILESEEYVVQEPALAKSDPAFMALMNSSNADVAALALARAENNSSIAMSRTLRFLEVSRRGLLPVPLEAFLAHTGRYTAGTSEDVKSDGLNLQNLNKRTGDTTLRQCVLPPEGRVIVACDSSQIEARTLAWLAQQLDLLADFSSGADPYCRMASTAYGDPYDVIWYWTKGEGAHDPNGDPALKKKYKRMRNVGKTMVLQLGYFSGAAKLALYLIQNGLQLHENKEEHDMECARLVSVYRNKNDRIRAFWRVCEEVLKALVDGRSGYFGGPEGRTLYYDGQHDVFGHKTAAIMFPDGYWLVYNNLRVEFDPALNKHVYKYDLMDKGKKISKIIHSGVLCNNVTQGLAFALMRWQSLLINRRYAVRINIHDAWGIVVREQEQEEALAYIQECMRQLPAWAAGLPIACEAEVGNDFTVV